ncbi:AAA family ATPase [Paenibacillus sp. GYB003]|uniref:AAA family ATPase n=1 Tax=Paenibacillus sp. GYB003 TaxID=2994392 RepID=UPI002F9665C2
MFFLQMAGYPGSGKSTLARRIAKRTGAVVIDHDIVKSALVEGWEGPIDSKAAGKLSYHIEWSLIDFHLSQGHSVILDSPCLYTELVRNGTALASKHKARYKYVECYANDADVINERLRTRERKPTQIQEIPSMESFLKLVDGSQKPAGVDCLVVDSTKPPDSYIDEVIEYIRRGSAESE